MQLNCDLNSTARITNLVNPTGAQDGATKSYVDTAVSGAGSGTFLPLAGGTMTGNTKHNDDVFSYWGNSDDLSIQHNNSGQFAQMKNYTGDLYFTNTADNKDIIFQADNSTNGTETYLTLDGSNRSIVVTAALGVYHNDGVASRFGDAGDLQIYHNGTNSFIDESGTGNLFIRSNTIQIRKYTGEDMITCLQDNAVTLYFDNSPKLATSSTGISVTGSITIPEYIVHQGDSNTFIGFPAGDRVTLNAGGNSNVELVSNGVSLRYNGGTRLSTESTGVSVTGGVTTSGSSSFAGNISVADDINITNAGGIISFTGAGYIGAADNFYVGGASNGTDHTYIGDNGRNVTIYNGATFSGALTLSTVAAKSTAGSIFLTMDGSVVKYRSAAQVLSDIGGAPATGGSYLPLTAGSTKPLTGDLYLAKSSNQGQLFFGTANANYEIFGGGTFGYMGYNTDGYHRFLIQGSEKMRIHSNSNVGIGATLPNAKLEVTGDLNDNWAGRFENTNSGGFGILAKIAGTSANEKIFEARVGSNAKMLVTGDGNTTFAGNCFIRF